MLKIFVEMDFFKRANSGDEGPGELDGIGWASRSLRSLKDMMSKKVVAAADGLIDHGFSSVFAAVGWNRNRI